MHFSYSPTGTFKRRIPWKVVLKASYSKLLVFIQLVSHSLDSLVYFGVWSFIIGYLFILFIQSLYPLLIDVNNLGFLNVSHLFKLMAQLFQFYVGFIIQIDWTVTQFKDSSVLNWWVGSDISHLHNKKTHPLNQENDKQLDKFTIFSWAKRCYRLPQDFMTELIYLGWILPTVKDSLHLRANRQVDKSYL